MVYYTSRHEETVNIAGWSSSVARRAHNPKVVSSNLAPATKMKRTFKQVEVIGKEEMITHLPECSFLLYPISCFLSGLVSRVFSAHFLLT